MTLYYFTATGNSLDIAKRLAERFGATLRSIPQEHGPGSCEDDAIGIIFPVYAANLPAIVTRWIRRTKLSAPYIFAVAVHGGDPGGIGAVLAKSGLAQCDNVFDAETWSNYLPFNPDTPPEAIDVTAAVERIAASIAARESKPFGGEGAEPFETAPWYRQALDYRWRKDCTGCGTCMRVCPVANYWLDANNPDANGIPTFKFSDRCEGCLACVQNCPTAALHMPNEPTRYRYRNPNISLEEIIAANNQNTHGG